MGVVLEQTFTWTISCKDSPRQWPESCKLLPSPPTPQNGTVYPPSRPVDPNFSIENVEEKNHKFCRCLYHNFCCLIKKMNMTRSYMNSSNNSFKESLKFIQAAVVFPVGSQTLHSNSQAPWLKTHRLGTHTIESSPGLLFPALWFQHYLMLFHSEFLLL